MYVRALTDGGEVSAGPIGEGAEVYNNCASCHGAGGWRRCGLCLHRRRSPQDFPEHRRPNPLRLLRHRAGTTSLVSSVYGNPDRDGGAHQTGVKGVMPGFGGQLSDEEIVAVICHERYTLAGADPTSEEYETEFETWCSRRIGTVRRGRNRCGRSCLRQCNRAGPGR